MGPALLGTLSSQFLDHSCIWGSILRQGLGMTAEESQGLRPLGRGRLKLASPSCAERGQQRKGVISGQAGFSEAVVLSHSELSNHLRI